MLANDHLYTLSLSSAQAAGIAAWLHKCDREAPRSAGARADVLESLATQLDDARWIGRWLREEPRLSIAHGETGLIQRAVTAAMAFVTPSEPEELALTQLLSVLESAAVGQTPQLVYASALACSGVQS